MGWAGTVLPNGNQNNRPMKGIQCNHPQNYLALKAAKVFGNQISFQSPADRRLHVKSASFVDRSFWTSGLTDCNSTWRMQSMSHAARSSWSWRLSLTFPNTFKVWKMWNRNRQAMNIRCVWKGEPACVYWGLMHRNGWSQNSSRVRPLTSLSSTTNNTMWMGILWRKLKTGPVFSIKTLSQNLMPILLNNAITIYYLLPTSKKMLLLIMMNQIYYTCLCRTEDRSQERAPKRIKLEPDDKASDADVTSIKKALPGRESGTLRDPIGCTKFWQPEIIYWVFCFIFTAWDHLLDFWSPWRPLWLRKKFQINSCAELITDEEGSCLFLVSTGKTQFLQSRELSLIKSIM